MFPLRADVADTSSTTTYAEPHRRGKQRIILWLEFRKCDLTQPSCNQCTKRNLSCPGYEKRWKFMHQTTGSIQKDQQEAALILARQSIDELAEPDLADAALDLQQKEFASCGKSYRALATVFIGRKYKDMAKVTCSRHMYSRALNYLTGVIQHPRFATTEETLAAGILLAMYEMVDGITGASWLTHTRGLATMIQMRGAFLGELVDIESQSSTRSELGLIVDRAFIEVASCPGWLAETSTLIRQPGHTEAKTNLVSEILQCTLVHLRQASILAWQQFVSPIPWDFVDPFAQSLLYGMRLGISLLNRLFILLSADLRRRYCGPEPFEEGHIPGLQSPNPWSALDADAQEWQVRFDPEYLQDSYQIHPSGNSDWMDRIAMSIGMLGIRA
ncbi:Zn(II)2Cys6 transcription factor domain-containing protein [Aspergillus alliaceus]|uniref:Zn(II)2Cys6 transcription factor domain-containing protein n=1 Tax=Petromyces alliaceus TaxID=209559 RepID=UPI0012A4AFA3|nr:uncharacterized protein BDW43DRAFT_303154 [Aspergillus alliaceus]KAB8229411.1 hypothetical protein BDW43DRAFT_303154 [Aspergillus alliaceus]